MKYSKTTVKTTILQQNSLLMSVCSVDRQQTLSRLNERRISVGRRQLQCQLIIGRVVVLSWVGVAPVVARYSFLVEKLFKSLIGNRKVVERHGRCLVENSAPSDLLVTLDKLSGTVVSAHRFVYISFSEARS